MPAKRVDMLDRLASIAETEGGCWLLPNKPDHSPNSGYVPIRVNGRNRHAHRVVYEVLRGDIPAGLSIDHLCRVRACVNPWHMEPVTLAENTLRGDSAGARNARKTHCLRGHEFTSENTYVHGGARHCRACMPERWARDNEARKALRQARKEMAKSVP